MPSHDDDAQLEQTFGPADPYSEYKRGERIRYRLPGEEGEFTGVILWATEGMEAEPRGQRFHMHYFVQRDDGNWPDIVFPVDIIEA